MSLQDVRKAARTLSDNNEEMRKNLLAMGCRPDGVAKLCDSRQVLLHGVLTTEPPEHLKKELERK